MPDLPESQRISAPRAPRVPERKLSSWISCKEEIVSRQKRLLDSVVGEGRGALNANVITRRLHLSCLRSKFSKRTLQYC